MKRGGGRTPGGKPGINGYKNGFGPPGCKIGIVRGGNKDKGDRGFGLSDVLFRVYGKE